MNFFIENIQSDNYIDCDKMKAETERIEREEEGLTKKQKLQKRILQELSKANDIFKSIHPAPNVYAPMQIITSTGEMVEPQYDVEENYSQQFWRVYGKNQEMLVIMKKMSDRLEELKDTVNKIQKLQNQYKNYVNLSFYPIEKEKRKNRRFSNQIQKKYTCPYARCYKDYGSDVSMNLHIKLKHNGGNKSDRQKLAEAICMAELEEKQLPKMSFNLPPGFLEEYRQRFFEKKNNPNNSQKEKSIHEIESDQID